jgi:histidinol-phosphatase
MADRENRSPPAPPAPPADPAELSDELELAFELAALGTSIAVPRFEHGDFTVTRKPDGSPVTNADQAVERAQRELLAARRPDHAIIGEEFGPGGRSDWCWYLDPIDGTSRFIKHDPGWMTLVALAHRGRVLVGVVAMPALGERWWAARGAGAFHDGARLSVSSTSCLADAVARWP